MGERSKADVVSMRVGDGDRRIVQRRGDVGHALSFDYTLGLLSNRHYLVTFFLPAIARRGPFFVRALV